MENILVLEDIDLQKAFDENKHKDWRIEKVFKDKKFKTVRQMLNCKDLRNWKPYLLEQLEIKQHKNYQNVYILK